MPVIRTHEICADGLTSHLKKKLALAFGLSVATIAAWCHPKESDLDPTGTGKRNPLDQIERYIRVVHPSNPGNARQAAQYGIDLVDELDRADGLIPGTEASPILSKLRTWMKESADVSMVLAGSDYDQRTLFQARREIAQERAALERLDAAVLLEIQRGAPRCGIA